MGNVWTTLPLRTALTGIGLGLGLGLVSLSAQATEITVTFSDAFSQSLEEDYGPREGDYLTGLIEGRVLSAIETAGLESKIARVDVTLNDAKPNRPTLRQLSKTPGLSMQSFSIGGASLTGRLYDAQSTLVGEVSHDWFESDIRQSQYNATWTDAQRAINRFARKLATTELAPTEATN